MEERFFFIVGAQRCGTTYLTQVLNEHPDICMAQPFFPEPKFFLRKEMVDKGKGHYLSTYFKDCPTQQLKGEKSTSYLESPEAAKTIHRWFPDSKIIVSLRNPALRAISNFNFTKANGLEPRSMEEVFIHKKYLEFDSSNYSVSPHDYLERGIYLHYLKKYEEEFGRENIHVVIFEKLIQDKEEWRKLFNFLEVNTVFTESMKQKVNETSNQKVLSKTVLDTLLKYYEPFTKELEQYLQQDLRIWNF